jgi:hypothetical protein
LKSGNSATSRAIESFFDGLSLGEIKQSGPSPGVGHEFTNSQTLGGIKAGPSPCCGNKYTTGTHHWLVCLAARLFIHIIGCRPVH